MTSIQTIVVEPGTPGIGYLCAMARYGAPSVF